MKKLGFKKCRKLGCTGEDCEGFKLAYEKAQILAGCYFDPDNTFKEFPGEHCKLCWVEVEEDEP